MHGPRIRTRPSAIRDAAIPFPQVGEHGAPTDIFAHLCDAMRDQIDSLAGGSLERLGVRVSAWGSASFTDEEIAALCRASIQTQLHHFRLGALPAACPEGDAASMRIAGAAELEVLLGLYRACQAVLWGAWFELIEDSRGLAAEWRRGLLGSGSAFFSSYADLLIAEVTRAYLRELRRLEQASVPHRLKVIRSLLGDGPAGGSSADFDLSRHHLGLIAWGEDPVAPARELARVLQRPLLAVCPPEHRDTCWAWLSATRPLDRLAEQRLGQFQPSEGRLAIGLEVFGADGFRATHRQALRARGLAQESGPPALSYADVVVVALACENEGEARAFLAHELRGIEDESSVSLKLRETLAAYFASEYNAASAAADIGVHEQTVANRLRAAEERLGHPVAARRLELELALRLRAHLVADPSS